MKRVIVGLFAALIAWLGLVAPLGHAFASSMAAVQTYAYDSHQHSSTLTTTTSDRGPPTSHNRNTAYDAVDHGLRGSLARPKGPIPSATYDYDHPAPPVQVARDAATTAETVPGIRPNLARETRSQVAADTAGSADTIVLGHYPEYVDVAKATGGRTFQIPTKVWDSMTPEQQWAANQKFLDRAIARGSNVQLATPATAAREGSFYERELQYMQSQGYTVGPNGMSLIAPGGR